MKVNGFDDLGAVRSRTFGDCSVSDGSQRMLDSKMHLGEVQGQSKAPVAIHEICWMMEPFSIFLT